MVLSRRERITAIVAVAALAVLVLDHYVIAPLFQSAGQLADRRVEMTAKLDQANVLLARQDAMKRKWDQMLAGGLKADPAGAEVQTLQALQDLADQAGLSISSMRPERSSRGDVLRQITIQTSGTGSMASVSRFLYLVESSQMPLRITDLQVGARREGTDDLSLVARISTLYLAKPVAPTAARAQAKTKEGQS